LPRFAACRRLARRGLALDLDAAVVEQRRQGADRRQHWRNHGADHADTERELGDRALTLPYDDASHVALVQDLLELVDELTALDLDGFPGGTLGHTDLPAGHHGKSPAGTGGRFYAPARRWLRGTGACWQREPRRRRTRSGR